MRLHVLSPLLLLIALVGSGCGGGDVPLPAEKLLELFPGAVRNLPEVGRSNDVQGAPGFEVSRATIRYGILTEVEGPAVTLSIMDLRDAAMAETMGFGWGINPDPAGTLSGQGTTERIEAEMFDGYPARRTRDATLRRDQLKLVVNKRFLVEVRGEGVDPDVVDEAMRAIELDKLPG
jgi:hypothetical protein